MISLSQICCSAPLAVITEFSNSSIAQTRYLHRAHQGSTDTISDREAEEVPEAL